MHHAAQQFPVAHVGEQKDHPPAFGECLFEQFDVFHPQNILESIG